MENTQIKNRRFDIDWIRILLIISVFFFHVGMFFNGFGWHIKNNVIIEWLNPVMAYLHQWRMPLLFFVSGVGTYFALGKRNVLQYVGERSKRLLIPLTIGMFLIVPPQIYVEKHTEYNSFIDFIPHIAEGTYPEGNLSWHHLWFILYLFICSVAALPIIILFKSKLKEPISNVLYRFFSIPASLLIFSIPLFLVQFFMRKHFPWETHALVNDWPYLIYSFLFFVFGFVLFSDFRLINQIVEQRRIHGIVAFLLTLLFFLNYSYSFDTLLSKNLQLFLGCLMEWSIGISVIGYGGKYFNKEHKFRRHLNEAIYPFYILHQTIIIVIGYQLYNLNMDAGLKALIITLGTLLISFATYFVLIKPFKITRLVFGMRIKKSNKKLLLKED